MSLLLFRYRPVVSSLTRLKLKPYRSSAAGMATTTDWNRVTPPGVPPFHQFSKPIQKSENDDRDYRLIRLENDIEALLIHDAKADKAAASLDVSVGHLSDPDDMPGMAHFCEHLLFMGTEPFPVENEYSQYLAKNNGASNAYTSVHNTNYYFSVATTALPGALERFAAFFHSPLFDDSCTSRELSAVDSEHKKNHQNDLWRIFQLNKHLSKQGHPWRKFGSGNRDSLLKAAKELKAKGLLETSTEPSVKANSLAPTPIPSRVPSPSPSELDADGGAIGRETRRRLVEWWEKEYCAGRMRLCILGKESVDELSNLASTLFSPIPNRKQEPFTLVTEHPFGENEFGTLVSTQTIMDFYALEVTFPLEWQAPLWRLKPSQYIAHVLGHEGHGSLHSYLKQKGWLTDLSTGAQTVARGFAMFRITAYLTLDGFKNYRSVLLAIFKYLALIRESQFPAYLQKEEIIMDTARFRFKEKGRPDSYVAGLSARLPRPYPRELILSASSLTWPWSEYEDPEAGERKVREYLEAFRIQNGRVVLMAQAAEFEKLEPQSHAQWESEPIYGTLYRVERWDADFIKRANESNDIPELSLPAQNEFIPENLDVDKREVAQPEKRPHLIRETPLSSLWHKKDDTFWVPKAFVFIDIRSHFANESARAAVLNSLYADLVTDSLTEYAYDASLAGLSYRFAATESGLWISTNGYNDKLPVLTKNILEKSLALIVQPERLAIMKEEAKRNWENFLLSQAYTLADFNARYLMTDGAWTIEERLKELASVTAEEVQQFISKVFTEVNMRILVVGNIYKDEAIKIAEMAERNVGVSSRSPQQLNERALVLPEGCNYTWTQKMANPNDVNSGLTYFVRYGPTKDQRLRVTAGLLTQILKEPAFDILRTKEQLGYIVSLDGWGLPGGAERGLRVIVQSEKPAEYCELRVEEFFNTMKTNIEEMSPEVFQEQKNGLEKKWRETAKNLGEETDRYSDHIDTGHLDFLRREKDADLLPQISKDEVLALFMSKVHQSSKTRSKLSIHMLSRRPPPPRVSLAAAEAFAALVKQANIEVDEAGWRLAYGPEPPTATTFGEYWLKVIGDKPEKDNLLKAVPELLARYPVAEVGPRPEVTHIEDAKAFRAGLKVSEDPGAFVEWGDLPTAKF